MKGAFTPVLLVTLLSSLSFAPGSAASGPVGESLRPEVMRSDSASGFCSSPFVVRLTAPVAATTVFFTTNGAVPEPETGFRYDRPVPIVTTTIFRAAAFDSTGNRIDDLARSFIFLAATARQTGQGWPRSWGQDSGWTIPAHYGMDEVACRFASDVSWLARPSAEPAHRCTLPACLTCVQHSVTRLMRSLASIPSISILTDPRNLFSPDTGIYTHPTERGSAWERPAVVEWIDTNGIAGFQERCGLRLHGGMSRQPRESPKHSFRLLFKRRYGSASLEFPLFGDTDKREVRSVVLRAGNNDSWLASDGAQRHGAIYLRDEWMRRTFRVMGHSSARGRFIHLYLNGLYWGLYNLCEWPAAPGGSPTPEYDLLKGDQTESGDRRVWEQALALADAGLGEDGRYQAVGERVNLSQLADYLLLNFYAGNSDWDRSANWYAIRPRVAGGRFQFFPWDAECILQDPQAQTIDFDDDASPPGLFHRLAENARFRALFAERAALHTRPSGALAPGPAGERFLALAQLVGPALVAESARWGTYRRAVHSYKSGPYDCYTLADYWEPEADRLRRDYFPRRTEVLQQQLNERGLLRLGSTPKTLDD